MNFYNMDEKELKKLLAIGETNTAEFKEIPNKAFYKTISAFANTKGGIILLGVDKNSNPVGIELSTKFLEDLTNRIVNKLSLYPDIETIVVDNNSTDSTIEIAREYADKVFSQGRERSAQRNYGVRESEGKYVFRSIGNAFSNHIS